MHFFSNQWETLADQLIDQMFLLSKAHPLSKRFVVIPQKNAPLKNWLIEYFASHPKLKICAGIQFVSSQELLSQFISPEKHLTKDELFFIIEKKIIPFFKKQKMMQYLEYDGENISQNKQIDLSNKLSELFILYGLYPKKQQSNWQSLLWEEIFSTEKYPLRDLVSHLNIVSSQTEIHIFALPFLPPIYFEAFCKISQKIPTFFYHLSYCKIFWGDFASDSEIGYWSRKYKQPEPSLEESHPLLANWGVLCKQYQKTLDAYDVHSQEKYPPYEKKTLLAHLQNDLLKGVVQKASFKQDASLQIIGAGSSHQREIEILKDLLTELLASSETELSDILVLAPQIHTYEPFIHLVFKPSALEYKIQDLDLSKSSYLIRGLLDFFNLPFSKWDLKSIFALFENPLFLHKISFEEVQLLKRWAQKAKIRMGYDEKHMKCFFSDLEAKAFFQNTWQKGFDRMLSSLAFLPPTSDQITTFSYPYPVEGLDFSHADLLLQFIEWIDEIRKDTLELEKKVCSLKEWSEVFEHLREKYFHVSDEETSFKNKVHSVFADLKSIRVEGSFSFQTVLYFLKDKFFQNNATFGKEKINAISFRSLKEGAIHSAKTIIFLGMQEDFPRIEKASSLQQKTEYYPTCTDIDRNLFLEALVSAKDHFFLLFQNISSQDGKPSAPSTFLLQLQSFIKAHYSSHFSTTTYPLKPYDARLFEKKPKSFSRSMYLAAKTHYETAKKRYGLIHEFEDPYKIECIHPTSVHIKHLSQLASNPLKFYLNQTLQIYLEEEEDEDKEFCLSFLDLHLIKNHALKAPLEQILAEYSKKGQLPLGLFQKGGEDQIKIEHEKIAQHVKALDIGPIYTLDLSVKKHFTNVPLLGEIKHICSKGLVLFKSIKKESIVKHWPQILTYLLFYEKTDIVLFSLQDGVAKHLQIKDPQKEWDQFFSYYLTAQKTPCPFLPKLAEALFKNDLQKAFEKLNQGSDEFKDPYFNWLFKDKKIPDVKTWPTYLQNVYSALEPL